MRINLLSSFAAGILLATTISGTVYLTEKKDAPKPASAVTKSVPVSEEEMKQQLEAKGYVVQTNAQYDENLKNAQAAVQPEAAPENKEAAPAVTKVIINVSQGMTSIDVGRMLVQAGLVENAFNFSTDIEAKGLQNKLKPGTFVVDSNMSYDQLVATIFPH